MAVDIPPWLNVNPLAPVEKYIAGYGQGVAVGQGNRANERAEYESEVAAEQMARQDERMAFQERMAERQAQLQETARLMQIDQVGEGLRMKREAAQREADIAARQLAAQKGVQDRMSQGVPFEKAWLEFAPALLGKNPERLPAAYKTLSPPKPVWVPAGAEGAPGYYDLGNGNIRVPPQAAKDFGDDEGRAKVVTLGGRQFLEIPTRNGGFRYQPVESGNPEATNERLRLSRLNAQIRMTQNQLEEMWDPDSEEAKALREELAGMKRQLQEGDDRVGDGLDWPQAEAMTPEKQKQLIREANEAISRGAPEGAVKQRLRQMGIDVQ